MPLRSSMLSGNSSTHVRQRARHAKPTTLNLDSFVTEIYLPHIQLRKQSWYVDERIARQYISPTFGTRNFAAVERYEVEDWLQELAKQGLASATCNRILAVFKSICSCAVRHGLLPAGQSPCVGVSPFKIRIQRERYLSREEALRLMQELKKSDRQEAVIIRLLLFTGARKSEILKARWEDVHLDLHLLTVPISKSGRTRHIALSDEAMTIIRAIPRVIGSPWLFPGHTPDKPLSDIFLFWNKVRRKLGLVDVRIHDLRHTFASFLVNAGHTLYEVQKLLGHSDPRTTMRYAHLGQASLLAATQTVRAYLLNGKWANSGKAVPYPFQEGASPCRLAMDTAYRLGGG